MKMAAYEQIHNFIQDLSASAAFEKVWLLKSFRLKTLNFKSVIYNLKNIENISFEIIL